MARRFRRLAHLGIAGWITLGRRVAPWGLLVFALFQLKALSDKVKQVEESEFSQVQSQVEQLRGELTKLSDSARDTEKELYQTRQTLKSVNLTLEQARKKAPELAKAIDDAHEVSVAVKSGLPQASDVEQLSATLTSAGTQINEVAHALPDAKAAAALTTGVQNASQSVLALPDVASAQALAAQLAEEKKQLETLSAALPRAEQAQALAKALDADAAALAALKDKTPNAEQLQALQRDLAHAHEVLANIAPAAKPVAN